MPTELAEFLIFTAPTYDDVQEVRAWRNADIAHLRTPFLLTEKMQKDFYYNVVCDRNSSSRFWSLQIQGQDGLIGFAGLINIQWENRIAEISLLINPKEQGKGHGNTAVYMMLRKGFRELNLINIFAECYHCNKALGFWQRMQAKYGGSSVNLPNRKFWDGQYWDSSYFNFNRLDYHKAVGQ